MQKRILWYLFPGACFIFKCRFSEYFSDRQTDFQQMFFQIFRLHSKIGNIISWMRLDLPFLPSFCKAFFFANFIILWENSGNLYFELKFELTKHFFSLSIIIRGIKIGSDYDKIWFISRFFPIHLFSPITFVYTLIG